MLAVLSPYHLTSRDPAALAALLFARRVLTILPVPPAGVSRDAVRAALRASPPYARLLASWEWAAALFESGVIESVEEGHDPIDEARLAATRIGAEGWVALRPFMHDDAFAADAPMGEYLDAVSLDVLKGGPDPGWSLPIVSGLDAFAAQSGWVSFRAGQGDGRRGGAWRHSRSQVAERRLCVPTAMCTLAVPIIDRADAGAILFTRESLAGPIDSLGRAIEAWPSSGAAGVRAAARDYTAAFDELFRPQRATGADSAELPRDARHTLVRLTLAEVPVDAALLAATAATGRPGAIPASCRAERRLRILIVEPMTISV
ncbi:MAG: hypothetical protein AB7K52_05660 [Phycisphaerales bacterium]